MNPRAFSSPGGTSSHFHSDCFAGSVRGAALIAAIGIVPYYLYRSMRRVYAQGVWRTLLKCTALSIAYVACALCMAVIAGLFSAETL